MSAFWQQLFERATTMLGSQPLFTLILGAALVAVFLRTVLRAPAPNLSLSWSIWTRLGQVLWAVTLVGLLWAAASGLGHYLDRTSASFRHDHGRVTEANLGAVRTIWGPEQQQGELTVALSWQEETIERLESEDPTRPTVTRKRLLSHNVTENPFVRTRHVVTIQQSPRRKGPAVYPGYTSNCQFSWRLRNPADREVRAVLRFPLPGSTAMYDDLAVNFDGLSVRNQLRVEGGALVLERSLPARAEFDFEVGFQSRGLAYWYFQVREQREIRDFELTLRLPNLPTQSLNYPEGCMTPTTIAPAAAGCVLTYRLDRALSNKGMGIEMPKLVQPGERTGAVLAEVRKGWLLLFAAILLGGALTVPHRAPIVAVLVGAATTFAYALLGDLSDTPLGFWGSSAVLILPVFLGLAVVLRRSLPAPAAHLCVLQLVVFGLAYPWLAALDAARQLLYLNLSACVFLAGAAALLVRRSGQG